jgi:hypothetical protein
MVSTPPHDGITDFHHDVQQCEENWYRPDLRWSIEIQSYSYTTPGYRPCAPIHAVLWTHVF